MKHGLLTLSIVNLIKSKHQREINYLPETLFTKSCFLEAMSIKKCKMVFILLLKN
jgi:hypothetical protein